MRVGIGYDVHRLVAGRSLILGGVTIPFEKGLLGHSDADVLVHAVCDALLGAAGLGDIGRHFPDSDERYKDISSMVLLRECHRMLRDHGHALVNLDATIFAEAPRLASPCARCEEVVIISYSNPEYPGCAAPWREQWLRERFPQTTRIVINPARPETLADLPEEFRAIPANDAPETRLHHFERRYPPANRNPVAHHTESVRYGGRTKDWAA